MSKSSRFIWLNSFANDEEAPVCPHDISEPAWAQLLYNPLCQVRCVVSSLPLESKVFKRRPLAAELLFLQSYGCVLGFVPSIVQKMSSAGVGFCGK